MTRNAALTSQAAEHIAKTESLGRAPLQGHAIGQLEPPLAQHAVEQEERDERRAEHDEYLDRAEHDRSGLLDLAQHLFVVGGSADLLDRRHLSEPSEADQRGDELDEERSQVSERQQDEVHDPRECRLDRGPERGQRVLDDGDERGREDRDDADDEAHAGRG